MDQIPLHFKRGVSENLNANVPHQIGNIYLVEDKNELFYDKDGQQRAKITDTMAMFYVIEEEIEFTTTSEMRLDFGILDVSSLGA